ncbi:MAG: TetR/AcrR family transcriptional regulator [Candidatus Hydrogenedentota bacterium]
MTELSERQLAIQRRESEILGAARDVLLERGYFGLTMKRVADAGACPKGTVYQWFGSKEDLLVALALRSLEKRVAMMERGANYPGLSRERVLALGEAVSLFTRLYPDDSRILYTAMGPVREKATPKRLLKLTDMEQCALGILRGILEDAVAEGNLVCENGTVLREMAFGIWALVDGSITLITNNSPRAALGIQNPFTNMFHVFNTLADAYRWRPLFREYDWEETLAAVRRNVFPEEAQAVYGEENWYGDRL